MLSFVYSQMLQLDLHSYVIVAVFNFTKYIN